MITSSLIIQTLNSLLIAINTIYICQSKNLVLTHDSKLFSTLSKLCSDYYLRVFYNQNSTQIHITLTVHIIQNITYAIYKTTIESIGIIILSRINTLFNASQAAQNYLERYKNTFRGSFTRNCIGSHFYDNDIYINKIAVVNLYVLFSCSKGKGIYILWIYLIFYKIQNSIFM